MLVIPASDTIAGIAPSGATEVTCTLFLMELNASTGVETYTKDQQQLPDAAATIYTATANGPTFVKSIHVVNNDTVNVSTFQLFVGGTADANAVTPIFTLAAGGSAAYEDGKGWQFLDANDRLMKTGGFSRIFVHRFIVSGAQTYYPSVGMKACIAILTGGGGGGGGADTAAGGSADVGVGGGGGAGGTAIAFFTAAEVGVSKVIGVGAAGTAGSSAGGNGGAGGNSTWESITAYGGAYGVGSASTTQDAQASAGGLGGVPVNAPILIIGGDGQPGFVGSIDGTTDLVVGLSGKGGVSFWGGGGLGRSIAQASLTTDAASVGSAGLAYGAGGGGALDLTTANGQVGGVGMAGIIVVIEFIG